MKKCHGLIDTERVLIDVLDAQHVSRHKGLVIGAQ